MSTATLTSTTNTPAAAATRPATFTGTLASEWLKLVALRSTHIILGLGVGLSIATTAVAGLAMGATEAEWPADVDPVLFSMVGNVFALIVFSVFGVLAASREYSNGMIGITLLATPHRGRVFFAKLVLVSLVTLVYGMVTAVGMFLAGKVVLEAYGLPATSLADGDAMRVVFGIGATMPFFPAIGLALGVLLRSTAGGITTVLGILWLPQIFGAFLPMWAREHVISLLPGSAVDSLTLGQLADSPDYSDPVLGALLAASWLLAIAGTAYLTFSRRAAY